MRAHQPGSIPIDIPDTVPNPAHTPAPAPTPERPPTRVPEKVPEKVIAPSHPGRFSFRREYAEPTRRAKLCGHHLRRLHELHGVRMRTGCRQLAD